MKVSSFAVLLAVVLVGAVSATNEEGVRALEAESPAEQDALENSLGDRDDEILRRDRELRRRRGGRRRGKGGKGKGGKGKGGKGGAKGRRMRMSKGMSSSRSGGRFTDFPTFTPFFTRFPTFVPQDTAAPTPTSGTTAPTPTSGTTAPTPTSGTTAPTVTVTLAPSNPGDTVAPTASTTAPSASTTAPTDADEDA